MIEATEALALLAADPSSTVLCSDFDGSLAEIVDDPAAAVPYPGVIPTIAALAESFALVAVVSGRPAAFLMQRLALQTMPAKVVAFGIYGREEVWADRAVRLRDDDREARLAISAFLARAEAAGLGAHAEAKGSSVTFHWRTAPELAEALSAFARDEARRLGLEVRHGRLSVEVVASGSPDKGTVVRTLGRGAHTIAFIGDDVGDLAAFDALDDLAAAQTTALRIAVRSPESPPALIARADLVLDGPAGSAAFLSELVDTLAHT